MMMLSIPYVYFLFPETRGVPLEKMDELFDGDHKPWRAHREVMGQLRAESGADPRDERTSYDVNEMRKEDGKTSP